MSNEENACLHELSRRIEREITEAAQWALNSGAHEPPEISPALTRETKSLVVRLMTDNPERIDSSRTPGDLPLTKEQALGLIEALETGREEIVYVRLRCGGPFVSSKEIWKNNDGTFTVMHCIDGIESAYPRSELLDGITSGELR